MNKKRIGFIGIIIEDRGKHAPMVNELLTGYGDIIVGRMGIPYHDCGFHVITLTVDGSTNEIGALTDKLGMIEGVTVKSAMAKKTE
ncbi:MAG: iron-only hydrogenase system regulator [Syntrophales bacterium]|nr:iron-only hydrogenase system regulator [Syntrophales bacterium]